MPEPDRISVSIGRKINLGNYESYDFHVSYSSDLEPGETPDAGYQRVAEVCSQFADKEEAAAYRFKSVGAAPKKELRLP